MEDTTNSKVRRSDCASRQWYTSICKYPTQCNRGCYVQYLVVYYTMIYWKICRNLNSYSYTLKNKKINKYSYQINIDTLPLTNDNCFNCHLSKAYYIWICTNYNVWIRHSGSKSTLTLPTYFCTLPASWRRRKTSWAGYNHTSYVPALNKSKKGTVGLRYI